MNVNLNNLLCEKIKEASSTMADIAKRNPNFPNDMWELLWWILTWEISDIKWEVETILKNTKWNIVEIVKKRIEMRVKDFITFIKYKKFAESIKLDILDFNLFVKWKPNSNEPTPMSRYLRIVEIWMIKTWDSIYDTRSWSKYIITWIWQNLTIQLSWDKKYHPQEPMNYSKVPVRNNAKKTG